MCHGSFGAGNYGMSGRAFDSRFLFAWPQSQISVMGAEQAANTLADVKVRQLAKQGKKLSQADIDAIRDPVLGEFKRKQSAYWRSEEHTSELQSLMRISYAVFCLKKKKTQNMHHKTSENTSQQRIQ